MANHIFTGSGVALITPMNSDGSVNYAALADDAACLDTIERIGALDNAD